MQKRSVVYSEHVKNTCGHNDNLVLDVSSLHSQLEGIRNYAKERGITCWFTSFLNQIIAKEKERYAGPILATTAVRTKISDIEHNSKNV